MSLNEEKVRELLRKIVCGYDLQREEKRIEFEFGRRLNGEVWDITIEIPVDPDFGRDESKNKYIYALIDHLESSGYEVGDFKEVEVPAKKIWEI